MLKRHLQTVGIAGLLALGLMGCDGSGRFSDFSPGRQAVAPPPPAQTFTPRPHRPGGFIPLASAHRSEPGTRRCAPRGLCRKHRFPRAPTGWIERADRIGNAPHRAAPGAARLLPSQSSRPRCASRSSRRGLNPHPRNHQRPRAPASRATGMPGKPPAVPAGSRWSSTPTLDLYKASLRRVPIQRNAGVFPPGNCGATKSTCMRGPVGGVSARLKQSGRNFEGASAKTGAPVVLSK